MNNIDRFNEVCAVVFARLYENFPEPIKLHGLELAGAVEFDMEGPAQLEKTDERTGEFCAAVVQWLVDAGYVLAPSKHQPAGLFMNARLTAKGLEAMKAMPSALGGSIGDELIDASQRGARDAARQLISDGLTAVFRAGIQVAGAS